MSKSKILENNKLISAIRCTYDLSRYIRDFIRKFDGHQPLIWDVYEEEGFLREILVTTPETSSLTSYRKRDMVKIFDTRKIRALFYRPVPVSECAVRSAVSYHTYIAMHMF